LYDTFDISKKNKVQVTRPELSKLDEETPRRRKGKSSSKRKRSVRPKTLKTKLLKDLREKKKKLSLQLKQVNRDLTSLQPKRRKNV